MTPPAIFARYPPPWHVRQLTFTSGDWQVYDGNNLPVGAPVYDPTLARLLAAAPGLVEALEELLPVAVANRESDQLVCATAALIDKARAALAALKEEA